MGAVTSRTMVDEVRAREQWAYRGRNSAHTGHTSPPSLCQLQVRLTEVLAPLKSKVPLSPSRNQGASLHTTHYSLLTMDLLLLTAYCLLPLSKSRNEGASLLTTHCTIYH